MPGEFPLLSHALFGFILNTLSSSSFIVNGLSNIGIKGDSDISIDVKSTTSSETNNFSKWSLNSLGVGDSRTRFVS